MSDKNEEKKWLVKNNNQIIGPFTESELTEELKKGYISPFATACVPGQIFWGFIAAYPEFAHHTDITKLTQFTKSLDSIKTYTFGTQTLPYNYEGEVTDFTSDSSSEVEDLPYKEIEKTSELTPVETKKKKTNLFLLIGSVVIFFVWLFFIFSNKEFDLRKSEGQFMSSDFGQAYFFTGDYSKAMDIWREKKKKNKLNKNNELQFQTLKFQLNNNISQGEEIIKLSEGQNPDLKKIIRALVQLKTGNLQSARQLFNELISGSQSKEVRRAAFANLALLSAKEGDCQFFKRYREDQFGNRNLISFSFSLCILQSQSTSVDQRREAGGGVRELSQRPQDYYQETLVGLAYIKSQKGQPVLDLIETLLDSDPELTKNYYYDVYIDRKVYSWPQFLPLCEQIYSTEKDNQLMITFYAYCLVRSHRHELAQEFIQKALLIDSKHVLIKTIHAYIAGFINLKDQSVLILGDSIRSNSDMRYVLPYILQAQFCEENEDWECAVQNWQLVLKNNPNSISSLGGLAYAKYNQGHYGEAKAYMERGFAIDDMGLYSRLLFVEKMLKEIETRRLNR